MLEKAAEVLPEAHLLQLDLLSVEWPDGIHQPFDRIISGYTFHEFTDKQKLVILKRLVAEHLAEDGVVFIADISFSDPGSISNGVPAVCQSMGCDRILLVRRDDDPANGSAGSDSTLYANLGLRRDLQDPTALSISGADK